MSTYWIQGSDYSVREEDNVTSARQIVERLDAHDWAAEHALLESLGDDGCPAGLGIVREVGIILHLCPNSDGTIMTSCNVSVPYKFLGFINATKLVMLDVEKLARSVAIAAIPKFLAADEAWLKANLK